MRDSQSHDENNSGDFLDHVLKKVFIFFKNTFQYLLGMDIEKKKAISLTVIIMTLAYFLGSRGVFLLGHVLGITSDYDEYSSHYTGNYIIFLIMWSPAIYLLSLYWNTKTIKFRLSLAYAIGLLTYRFNNLGWELYDFSNFISCLEISGLFVFLAAILIYFVKEGKE